MTIKQLFKLLYINSFIFVIIIFIGELVSRTFFPEFIGDYYSSKVTRSIKFHIGEYKGFKFERVPHPAWSINKNHNMFVVVGGSVSKGFGTRYEDIYWVRLKNLNNLLRKEKIEVIPFGKFSDPSRYASRNEDIRTIASEFNGKEKYILYQFSYPDIGLEKENESDNVIFPLDISIKKLAMKYFHKSVFIRVSKNYLRKLKRSTNNNKTCEEKGWSSLQEYSYAYGSKGLEKDAEKAWDAFSKNIIQLKNLSNDLNAKFFIFITPSIFDIDIKKRDKHYNTYGFDFSCATIDPRQRLKMISKNNNIKFIDPTEYMKEKFNAYIKEGNFKRFYFAADNSHITPIASSYLSDYLLKEIFYSK